MASSPSPRRRDAAASRDRLLFAAHELFAERGYDRTTARDIGERAGVDAAMIARYFGGKAHPYLEVIRSLPDRKPADLLEPERLAHLIGDAVVRGISPVYHTVSQPFDDPALQRAAADELDRRLIAPLRERLEHMGWDQPELRAQVLTAAFVGIMEARVTDVLPAVRNASVAELSAVVVQLFHGAAEARA